jgi:hypothetical protein
VGLDTSHGCWHGPYSAFSRWRTALQAAAGWPLDEVSDPPFTFIESRVINWAVLKDENFEGEWESIPEDPLIVLVAHSDCSGVIPVPALLPLAERLEGLAPLIDPDADVHPEWKPGMEGRATYDGFRAATVRFAAGLRIAAAAGEPVEFH